MCLHTLQTSLGANLVFLVSYERGFYILEIDNIEINIEHSKHCCKTSTKLYSCLVCQSYLMLAARVLRFSFNFFKGLCRCHTFA